MHYTRQGEDPYNHSLNGRFVQNELAPAKYISNVRNSGDRVRLPSKCIERMRMRTPKSFPGDSGKGEVPRNRKNFLRRAQSHVQAAISAFRPGRKSIGGMYSDTEKVRDETNRPRESYAQTQFFKHRPLPASVTSDNSKFFRNLPEIQKGRRSSIGARSQALFHLQG